MEQPLSNLIYDRTQADIDNQTLKGRWKKEDLNRIEEWTLFLNEKLSEWGYTANYVPPTHVWTREYFPTKPEIDRIRKNVHYLRSCFYFFPGKFWKSFGTVAQTVTWQNANNLEWDLEQLYQWLEAMVNGFRLREASTIFMEAGGVFNR